MRRRYNGPYKHGSKWRVAVITTGRGTRKTEYETFPTRAEAERCIGAAYDEGQGITVSDAVAAFLETRVQRGRAASSLAAYEDRAKLIVGPLMTRPVRHLLGRGAELYAAAQVYPADHRRAGQRRSADTHRNALIVGKMIGALCVKRGWLKVNPFADVEPVGARRHGADKIHLMLDEVRTLEGWCIDHGSELRAVLTLAYMYLGCRTSEVTKRNVRDVDDGGRLFWIRDTKSVAGSRRLLVPDVLAPLLVAICAGRPSDAPLFLGVEGERLSLGMATRIVRAVCVAAKVPEVTPQALRRTLATLATDAGVAGLALAASLGHGSTDVANESYIARGGAAAAAAARGIRVIQGGRK